MKRLNILLLSHYFSPRLGGIETVSQLLAEQFYTAGHEVRVVTWTKNVETDCFPFSVVRHPSAIHLIKHFFWANIILENNPCLRLSWPGFFIRKPNVMVLQTWLDHGNNKKSAEQRLKLKKLALADRVIAISDAIKQKSWPAATIIHNPYNEQVFKIIDTVRKDDFVFLGRLVSDKGADYAIKAIHYFIQDERNKAINYPKPLLTIIGDGPERQNLEELANELRLKDCVSFIGALQSKEIAKELNKHTYLLVPSLWEEPFGIVVLEAMACGCIPVISQSGGLTEAAGEAGISFENKNLNALIAALHFIRNNPELQAKCRQASSEHLKLHTAAKIANEYLKIIEALVKEKIS